jgi:hypothetical protein
VIKSFKEYLAETVADSAPFAFYHFVSGDAVAATLLESLLNEGTKTHNLGKGRAIKYHTAHVPGGQDHVHFLVKGHKVTALNRDGSAHDQSHGHQLLRWQIDGLQKHYTSFVIPKDGLIEQLLGLRDSVLLSESAEDDNCPAMLISKAEKALHAVK